jgi:phosphoglycerate dehydrogenase-like enzyme
VQSASAGVAASLHPGMRESDVVLTNAAGLMAIPIAEHVVGGVLHFLRGFDIAIQRYRDGVWDKGPFASGALLREAGECRALIVGAGGIGSAIAQRLSALGMPCVGVRRRVELGAPAGFERVVPFGAIDDELPKADVLVLATAHTRETRGMLSAARLDLLPEQAIVANVARGALLDEVALAERLRTGRLRGAILDVFSREPLPAESPLWGIGPMLFTPHVSAISPRRFWERQLDLFLDNWRRYVRGEPLANVVDKDAGY